MSKKKNYMASVLSFKRICNASDGLFFESVGNMDDLKKVGVRESSSRSTFDVRLNNPNKEDKNITQPQLQTGDIATLTNGNDTLVVKFNLQFVDKPVYYNCDNMDTRKALNIMHGDFFGSGAYNTIAFRVATNIANARTLWRNRLGCESIDVFVELVEKGKTSNSWEFDAFDIPITNFLEYKDEDRKKIKEIASYISSVYSGDRPYCNLEITIRAKKFAGMEVFPSQEIPANSPRNKSKNGEKTKFLYNINGQAAFHPQKITNALLCIDDWYPDAKFPISVNVYGSVTQEGQNYRHPSTKKDFYKLFDTSVETICEKMNETTDSFEIPLDQNEKCFVASVLIRGGVFGKSGKEKD